MHFPLPSLFPAVPFDPPFAMALRLAARASPLTPLLRCAAAAPLSTAAALRSSAKGTEQVELYRSPMARPVRILKTVSVTSASITVLFLPAVRLLGQRARRRARARGVRQRGAAPQSRGPRSSQSRAQRMSPGAAAQQSAGRRDV